MNLNTLFGIVIGSNINILHQLFRYFYHLACEVFIIKSHHRCWQVKGCEIIPIFKRSWHIVLHLQYHWASVLEVSSKRPRIKRPRIKRPRIKRPRIKATPTWDYKDKKECAIYLMRMFLYVYSISRKYLVGRKGK